MSFFERMMRINQPNPHPKRTQVDDIPVEMSRRDYSQAELMHSRSSCGEIQQEMPEVPQEPKPQAVYVSVKPVLLSCLLPKREQLLREMMAKKRQFELKKLANSNVAKGVELKQRLEESSFKFTQNIQAHLKPQEPLLEHVNSNKVLLTSSQAVPNATLQSSTGMHCKKSMKQSLVLDISASSRRKQSECSSVVQRGGDSLSREVMMRLLNMLQNQRNDRKDLLAMSMSNQYSHAPHEKQAPIIINNILKTPVDALNKDLIQRELKIKMLENNRLTNKLVLHPAYHPSHGLTDLTDNPLTQRSEIPNCQQFNPNELSATTKPLMKKQKISLECSRISIQSRQQVQKMEPQKMDVKKEVKEQEKQTKHSSNFSSQITENDQPSKPKPRERQFKRQKLAKNQSQNQAQPKPQKQTVEKQSPSVSQAIVRKASVRIDIPFNDSSEGQGLTLAQAFKKRIGRLKSQKQKSKKAVAQVKTPSVQIMNDQNYVKTQLYPQYKTPKQVYIPLFPLQSSQTVNLQKQSTKRNNPHRKQSTPINKEPQTHSKYSSREPSKQLIDRLIYGERAKVSKKEMYALTRKNYQNLPQIQAKKKEEEKKRLEQQRLAKIRQMQRSTRSLKQVKMTLQ